MHVPVPTLKLQCAVDLIRQTEKPIAAPAQEGVQIHRAIHPRDDIRPLDIGAQNFGIRTVPAPDLGNPP